MFPLLFSWTSWLMNLLPSKILWSHSKYKQRKHSTQIVLFARLVALTQKAKLKDLQKNKINRMFETDRQKVSERRKCHVVLQ